MLGKIFLVAAAAVGGIYLTSPEGKSARIALLRRRAALEPIVRDLLAQAKDVLEGAKQVNSDEIRANVRFLVNEVRATLLDVDLDKTLSGIREALRVAARRLDEAKVELASSSAVKNKATTLSATRKIAIKKVTAPLPKPQPKAAPRNQVASAKKLTHGKK